MEEPRIYDELYKLEKELETLDGAVKHIQKAEKISQVVISSVQDLSIVYERQLDKIRETLGEEWEEYSSNLKKLHQSTQEILRKSASPLQKSVEELAPMATTLTETLEEWRGLLGEFKSNSDSLSKNIEKDVKVVVQIIKTFLGKMETSSTKRANLEKNLKKAQEEWIEKNLTKVQNKNKWLTWFVIFLQIVIILLLLYK